MVNFPAADRPPAPAGRGPVRRQRDRRRAQRRHLATHRPGQGGRRSRSRWRPGSRDERPWRAVGRAGARLAGLLGPRPAASRSDRVRAVSTEDGDRWPAVRPATPSWPRPTARSFASLRRRPTSRDERYAMGRELRQQVPRKSLGDWEPPTDRPDPVQLIQESHEGRVDWLIPIRVARMVASPYGFLRGTAIVMADDVAPLPATGITPVICGDAHLGNFGFYASPEGELVIDLNDFDEAHPGGWEWDLRRLVASIWVAGRENGVDRGAVPRLGARLRRGLPRRGPVPGRAAAADAQLQPARRRPAARDGDREVAARRDRARRPSGPATGPATGRCPGSPPSTTASRQHRRGAAADHPAERRGGRRDRRRRWTTTCSPWRRTGGGPSAATRWSTSRTRWSASAASGCGRTWRCWRAAAPTTSSSCSSSRPAARCWPSTCTATRPGTPTRASGWWSTSRPCRRSATRCSAGPRSTGCSTTSASSAT